MKTLSKKLSGSGPNPSRKVRESPEDEGHVSDKWKREVTKVLKSFNASPGLGDTLKKLLSKEFKHVHQYVQRTG